MNVDFDQQDIIIELPPEGKDGRSIHPAGEWSADAEYHTLDLVSYNGSSYMATRSVPAGTLPTDAEYWQVVAEKGEPGASEWGEIAGNITDQTDLQEALDSKADTSDVEEGFADVAEALAGKANVGDSYTKTEENALLAGKANADDVYTKTETDTLLADKADDDDVYTKDEVDDALADKADSDSVYTKTEVDDALADKADSADVYTKDEMDDMLLDKAPVILSSASGSIASFTDGSASPVTALSVGIDPMQDLHGYDNPWPAGGGKNILDVTKSTDGYRLSITTGNPEANSSFTVTDYISCKELTTYTANWQYYSSANYGMAYYDSEKVFISGEKQATAGGHSTEPWTFSTPSGANYMRLTYVPANVDVNTLQIELGLSSTSFAPYSNICPISGHTECNIYLEDEYDEQATPKVTIDLGEERYGGTLDVLTGEMTVDRAIVDMGTLTWKYYTGEAVPNFYADISNGRPCKVIGEPYKLTCSQYGALPTVITGSTFATYGDSLICANHGATREFTRVLVHDSRFTVASDFKTAVTGAQLVYELATPIIVTLSPSQISTLLGTNHLWADTGDVTVTYRADTKRYIDGVASATAKVTRQMIADSATADGKAPKSLATGDLIIVGDELRKATANIGNGSAITASNSTTATLADVIKALQ